MKNNESQFGRANHRVYCSEAIAFDLTRNQSLFEKPWLDHFLSLLTSNSRLLDLGCGSGRPIARYLIDQGHQVTGLDFSPDMIDLARSYFPTHEWVVGDMRDPPQTNRYDGLISWDGFFHLNASEQRQLLPMWCELLKPSGALLLTIGHEAGEVTGTVNGKTVYHASLSIEEYCEILNHCGLNVVDFALQSAELYGHSVLLAQKN